MPQWCNPSSRCGRRHCRTVSCSNRRPRSATSTVSASSGTASTAASGRCSTGRDSRSTPWRCRRPNGSRPSSAGRPCRARAAIIGAPISMSMTAPRCPRASDRNWCRRSTRRVARSPGSMLGSRRMRRVSGSSGRTVSDRQMPYARASHPNRGTSAMPRSRRTVCRGSRRMCCARPWPPRRSRVRPRSRPASRAGTHASSWGSMIRRRSRWRPRKRMRQRVNSAITGVWSEGRSARRGSRSMRQALQRAASASCARMRSMRRPWLRRKAPCR